MSLFETDEINTIADNQRDEVDSDDNNSSDYDDNLQPTATLTGIAQYYKTNKGGNAQIIPSQRFQSPSRSVFNDETYTSSGRKTQLPPGINEDLTVDFTLDVIGSMRDIKNLGPVSFTQLDKTKSASQRILDNCPDDYILKGVKLEYTHNTIFGCGITMNNTIPVTRACSLNSTCDSFYRDDPTLPIPDALIQIKTGGPAQSIELFNLEAAGDYYSTHEFKMRREAVIPSANLQNDWFKIYPTSATVTALSTFYVHCVVSCLQTKRNKSSDLLFNKWKSGELLPPKLAKQIGDEFQKCLLMMGTRATPNIKKIDWSRVVFGDLSSLGSFLALVLVDPSKSTSTIHMACLETVMGIKLFHAIWGHIENRLDQLINVETHTDNDDDDDVEDIRRDNKEISIGHHDRIADLFLTDTANCSFYVSDALWSHKIDEYITKNGSLNDTQNAYLEGVINKHNMSAGSELLQRINSGLIDTTTDFLRFQPDQDQDPDLYNQVVNKIYQKNGRMMPLEVSHGFVWAKPKVIDILAKLNGHMSATLPQRPPCDIQCQLLILPSIQIDYDDEHKYTFQGKLAATYMRR